MNSSAPDDSSQNIESSLYEIRKKIYPRAVTGVFARWRWIAVWFTQLLYYGLPWLQWNERQAVLFNLDERRFYIFGVVLYPQDFIYLTGLLVISALALFLFTAVAGRLWCGFACPQTVYTEIFMWVERHCEGDRNRRMKLDQAPMSANKFTRKACKHAIWLVISLWTGVTFVGYFIPIDALLSQALLFELSAWAWFWILFYAFATWGNAGFMREQVCKFMCPYARFQSAMFDSDTLTITYDAARGDPRGARSRKTDPAAAGLGDCVNCSLCVQVCPTGIDIRDGLQYECIGCSACIDACDQVMEKMDYAKGLIRYDTENGIKNRWSRQQLKRRVLRPRVLIYSAILLAICIGLTTHLALRVPLRVDIIRDRGALAREVDDGMIENVYRLQILNATEAPQALQISVSGLDTLSVDGKAHTQIDAAANKLIAIRLRAEPGSAEPGSNRIYFHVTAESDADITITEKSTFYIPR